MKQPKLLKIAIEMADYRGLVLEDEPTVKTFSSKQDNVFDQKVRHSSCI